MLPLPVLSAMPSVDLRRFLYKALGSLPMLIAIVWVTTDIHFTLLARYYSRYILTLHEIPVFGASLDEYPQHCVALCDL